jgi:general secretion pathway protein L
MQVRSALTSTFPKSVKVVVDAPLQMEREVAALRQATGAASGRDLESMLAALAAAAPAGLAPTMALNFHRQRAAPERPRRRTGGSTGRPGPAGVWLPGLRSEGDTLVVRQGATP